MQRSHKAMLSGTKTVDMLRLVDVHSLIVLCLFGLAIVLSVYNLEYYPKPWFDEGWWLQIPKNLVLYGQYATRSSEGFRPYDTVISASPVFYLSVAAAFKLFGIGLFQARLVIALYFLLGCLFVYLLTRRLYGQRAALIALASFILIKADDNFTSATILGRMVMAEVPAVCFFMAATYLWFRSLDSKRTSTLILSGLLFGIAVTVKPQFLLNLLPAIVLLAAIDRFYYDQRRLRYFAIPLALILGVIMLQNGVLFALLGADNFARYFADLSAASGPQVRVFFSPSAMQNAILFFLRSNYMIWVMPGIVYSIILCIEKKPENIKACLLWMFAAVWWVWFLTASVGWARYTFPALAVSCILVAKLIDDLGDFSNFSLSKLRNVLRGGETRAIGRSISVFLLCTLLLAHASADIAKGIFAKPDRSAQQFAAYIDEHVAKTELVETWEWEVAFLTQEHTYHHPPTTVLNALIANQNLGAPYDPAIYDFQQYKPTYIVVGAFAKWTGLYPPDFLEHQCSLITSIGEYDLYKLDASQK